MFDQTPIRERTVAIGVFTAIALGGLGAINLLFTGGFASLPHSAEAAAEPEPAYVRVRESNWAPSVAPARITPTSYVIGEDKSAAYPVDDLAGDIDAPPPTRERSYEDISRDIDALYQQAAEYVPEPPYTSDKDESFKDAESASPW